MEKPSTPVCLKTKKLVSLSTPIKDFKSQSIKIPQEVQEVYSIIRKKTGTLGGNGYNGAIYGELTVGSMQKVVNILKDKCEMDHKSLFIDVGAGLGKPNMHVSQDPAVRISIGVELEVIRWQLSMHNLKLFYDTKRETQNGGLNFIQGDIDHAATMDPFTHIYMYDLGFPPDLQKNIAIKFNTSVHARWLVSYRPPRRVIEEYGYNVEFLHKTSTSMFGSGENHTAYFYKRIGEIPSTPTHGQNTILLPKRPFILADENLEVYSDPLFTKCIEETVNLKDLERYITDSIESHLNSGRSKRERKPRKELI